MKTSTYLECQNNQRCLNCKGRRQLHDRWLTVYKLVCISFYHNRPRKGGWTSSSTTRRLSCLRIWFITSFFKQKKTCKRLRAFNWYEKCSSTTACNSSLKVKNSKILDKKTSSVGFVSFSIPRSNFIRKLELQTQGKTSLHAVKNICHKSPLCLESEQVENLNDRTRLRQFR